jgi:dTDP-4-amino-4,6-dideoxygalactose transaminase
VCNKYCGSKFLVEKFEIALEEITGAPTICVSSGTAALHSAYAAINLTAGDEIITPPITFIATQAAAVAFGAKIVFADVKPDSGNIDPIAVEAAITKRTKAIVAVDFAGLPADLEELRRMADKFGLYLIEDASHSLGSTYRGQKVGSIADLTTFSFFPTKNITTGEGGAVSSIQPGLLEKAKLFSRQGLVRNPSKFVIKSEGPWHQEVHNFGLNYRLPDILCALGISQLRRLQQFKASRKFIFESYSSILGECKEIILPKNSKESDPMWHLYPILVPQHKRLKMFQYLHLNKIAVQVNYLPVYRHPAFSYLDIVDGQFPNADSFYSREISLPMYSDFTDDADTRTAVELHISKDQGGLIWHIPEEEKYKCDSQTKI